MSKQKVTIHDIARMANVSPSAVSLVLNHKPGVSEDTRNLVQQIIRETGYTPNLNSQKLILRKSFNIFIVVESCFAAFDNMFYNSAIMGVLESCRAFNYNVVLSDIPVEYASSSLKRAVDQKNIDGAIFLQDIRPDTAKALQEASLPFVVLDAHTLADDVPCVYCDYALAAEQCVSFLIHAGHCNIGFLGMGEIPAFHMACMQGYLTALGKAGLHCNPNWVIPTIPEKADVDTAVERLRACPERPDALFCNMDLIAIYAMQSLMQHGFTLPEDMSVCSIDNIVSAQYCYPALTTVDIDKKEMGKAAVNLLMALLERKPDEEIPVHICTSIGKTIVRDSVYIGQ